MKRIAIIGGGISGLAVLYYLKQRFADTVEITLFERQSRVGGTIHSVRLGDGLFESGPNGFLDHRGLILELIRELDLEDQLIDANPQAKHRYIQFNGRLYPVPMDPLTFITTPLLSPGAKCRLIAGLLKKDISPNQSIHQYVSKRFGPLVAEHLADPFISGIYAGDSRHLHMASTFPKMFALKKKKSGRMRMRSFKNGMGQLIQALYARYTPYIKTSAEITSLKTINADCIVCATPAYVAAQILSDTSADLSTALSQISYAPVAVAGVVLNQKAFKQQPQGFGYLILPKENKEVLGVLIESNVFAQRSPQGQVMIRVMLGGAHHPAIINDSEPQILAKALKELEATYGLKEKPLHAVVKMWPKAIPQYELNYPLLRQAIAHALAQTPHVYLCANYLDGISFHDCIHNAQSIAGSMAFP
ncbi:MAG: protoporphyrinogen oxidase [Candidatus Omnitrophica bacterium]|nr:protoporphyrinogen oxidase [Candidatus Omnitrophota bacterium]